MDEREEGNASRIRAQRAAAHARGLEAVRFEQGRFELVPAAFRADREQNAFFTALAHERAHSFRRGRVGPYTKATKAVREQAVQKIGRASCRERVESSVV